MPACCVTARTTRTMADRRTRFEQYLSSIWSGARPVPLALASLEPLYRLGRDLARHVTSPRRATLPVIAVGNLTVGGSGKTPVVIWLVELLRSAGLRPGVVSRGYGRRAGGVRVLGATADPAEVGDEPCLIAERTLVPVAVAADRHAAIAHLRAAAAIDLVVADDALQHHPLEPDYRVLVIDGALRFGNGRLLPAGPLREPVGDLDRFDLRLVRDGAPAAGEYGFQLRPGALQPVTAAAIERPRAGSRVHAVAGIARPERFFATLRALGFDPIEHPYADHHRFRVADLDFPEPYPIVITEKDAVKCRRLPLNRPVWCLPVTAVVDPRAAEALRSWAVGRGGTVVARSSP